MGKGQAAKISMLMPLCPWASKCSTCTPRSAIYSYTMYGRRILHTVWILGASPGQSVLRYASTHRTVRTSSVALNPVHSQFGILCYSPGGVATRTPYTANACKPHLPPFPQFPTDPQYRQHTRAHSHCTRPYGPRQHAMHTHVDARTTTHLWIGQRTPLHCSCTRQRTCSTTSPPALPECAAAVRHGWRRCLGTPCSPYTAVVP